MHVLGREGGQAAGPYGDLGTYIARDGSDGTSVGVDLDRPHAGLVVGKRGSGKSYTLGVLAEELTGATGIAPIVIDPLGVFGGLESIGGKVVDPTVRADALPPSAWPSLLGLAPTDPAGSLVWQAAAAAAGRTEGLDGMCAHVATADVPEETRRAAANYLDLAASWEVFAPDGLTGPDLLREEPTVIDCSGLNPGAANAVTRILARDLYETRLAADDVRFPWLLLDEAQVFFDGIARSGLETILTRGRAPGVSVVAATQRPSALPDVAFSQADLVVAHRLTTTADREALDQCRSSYVAGRPSDRLPTGTGEALIVDDVTESVHQVRIRPRRTPHGGDSPRVSDRPECPGTAGVEPSK